MAVSALLVCGLIRFSRCVSANTQRVLWFLVLVQGVVLFPLRLNIAWVAAPPLSSAAIDISPAPPPDLADDQPREHLRPPQQFLSGDSFVGTAATNSPAAEARPASAPHGVTNSLTSVWRCAVLLWGLGMLLHVAVGLWRYLRLVRRLQAIESPEEDWAVQWRELLASRGVSRLIPFRISRDVGPALVRLPSGYQVVVPEAVWERLTSEQRRLILCHELAHYEHGDLWCSLAVRLLALPHWFNPVSWWAVRKFEECTEWLCDCAAANESPCGASAIEYARARAIRLVAVPTTCMGWGRPGQPPVPPRSAFTFQPFQGGFEDEKDRIALDCLGAAVGRQRSHPFGGESAVGNGRDGRSNAGCRQRTAGRRKSGAKSQRKVGPARRRKSRLGRLPI